MRGFAGGSRSQSLLQEVVGGERSGKEKDNGKKANPQALFRCFWCVSDFVHNSRVMGKICVLVSKGSGLIRQVFIFLLESDG